MILKAPFTLCLCLISNISLIIELAVTLYRGFCNKMVDNFMIFKCERPNHQRFLISVNSIVSGPKALKKKNEFAVYLISIINNSKRLHSILKIGLKKF